MCFYLTNKRYFLSPNTIYWHLCHTTLPFPVTYTVTENTKVMLSKRTLQALCLISKIGNDNHCEEKDMENEKNVELFIKLEKAKLITRTSGRAKGYTLGRNLQDINLLEVMQAIGESYEINPQEAMKEHHSRNSVSLRLRALDHTILKILSDIKVVQI